MEIEERRMFSITERAWQLCKIYTVQHAYKLASKFQNFFVWRQQMNSAEYKNCEYLLPDFIAVLLVYSTYKETKNTILTIFASI